MKGTTHHKTCAALIIALIVISGVSVFWAYMNSFSKNTCPEEGGAITAQPEQGNMQEEPAEDVVWQTYTIPELGFSMDMPEKWIRKIGYDVGSQPGHEVEFWRDVIGRIQGGTMDFDLEITVKRSDLFLEGFNEGARGQFGCVNCAGCEIEFNGYPALREWGDVGYNERWDYFNFKEQLLIKSGDIYYVFDFVSDNFKDKNDARRIADLWRKSLSTFRATPITEKIQEQD